MNVTFDDDATLTKSFNIESVTNNSTGVCFFVLYMMHIH